MGKSKHRKNHAQKVKAFRQKTQDKKKQIEKIQKMIYNQYMQNQANARKEYIVETIYRNRPEFTVEVEGVRTLNMDVLEVIDGVLYWRADKNPILAGLEPLEVYPTYTVELVNELLQSIQAKEKFAVMQKAKEAYETAQANGGGEYPDLGLALDPTFNTETVSEVAGDLAVGDVTYTEVTEADTKE